MCRKLCQPIVHALILDYKADINAQDNESQSPLHVAANSGSIDYLLSMNLAVITMQGIKLVNQYFIVHAKEV